MRQRIASVDFLRGLTVAAMILVNSPGPSGAIFAPLQHADWDGWTLADLVFPFFLFIVGITTQLSIDRWRERSLSRRAALRRIVTRAALLVVIGVIASGFPAFHFATWRLPGILQRIGIVYFCVAILTLFGSWRATLVAFASILAGYSTLMTRVPVPGTDGLRGVALLGDPVNNMAAVLDRKLLDGRMDADEPVDPEGPTSTISAIGTAMLGVLTGFWLANRRHIVVRAVVMAIAGTLLCWLGLEWGDVLPINKQLWSSSFVLFSGGIAATTLAISMLLLDDRPPTSWTLPLRYLGENPLLLFVASGLLYDVLDTIRVSDDGRRLSLQQALYELLFGRVADPRVGSLAYAMLFLSVALVSAWMLHRKGRFWRV